MKRFAYFLFAWIFPWLALLVVGYPWRAFIACLLQASILGWPLAGFWAWRAVKEDLLVIPDKKEKTSKKSSSSKADVPKKS